MSDQSHHCTSFVALVHSLVGETVRVVPEGDRTTVFGKLVAAHTSFITVAVANRTDSEPHDHHDHTAPVVLVWIPLNRISALAEF